MGNFVNKAMVASAANGNEIMTLFFLKRGADIFYVDKTFGTDACGAARKNGYDDLAEKLEKVTDIGLLDDCFGEEEVVLF